MDSTTPSPAENPEVREARWLQQFQNGLNRLHNDPGEAARIDAIIREVEETPADGLNLLADPLVSAGARARGGMRLSGTRSSGAQPLLEAPAEPTRRPAGKRGHRLRGIDDAVGPAHRTWLEPIRHGFSTSGMTLNELAGRTGYSKSRLSQLMRGSGPHPRWGVTASVGRALGMPMPPMLRLWMNGAREAGKAQSWIDACAQETAVDETSQPLALRALTSAMAECYTAFASAFLPASHQAEKAVAEAFDLLWIHWETALASPNVHRHAWHVLRARVLSRAPRDRDGRVDMSATAFSTVATQRSKDLDELWIHVQETGSLLQAINPSCGTSAVFPKETSRASWASRQRRAGTSTAKHAGCSKSTCPAPTTRRRVRRNVENRAASVSFDEAGEALPPARSGRRHPPSATRGKPTDRRGTLLAAAHFLDCRLPGEDSDWPKTADEPA